MKNEEWKLEPLVEKTCIITIMFYGAIITLYDLMYLPEIFSLENHSFVEMFTTIIFVGIMAVVFLHYYTKIGFILPIIVTIFFIVASFIAFKKRRNPRVLVHPLVLLSIITSFVATFGIMSMVEMLECGF